MYIYIKTLFIYLLYLCINICNYYYTVKKSFVYNTYVFHQMYILHVSYIIYVSNTYIYIHTSYTRYCFNQPANHLDPSPSPYVFAWHQVTFAFMIFLGFSGAGEEL